jgi:hypothetical protein
LNPHGPCGPTDFHARLRLSPPLLSCRRVWGLDYPFTMSRIPFRFSGAARLVSTPSRPFFSRAWLGIAMLQGSPTLSSSAPPVSRRALKFFRLSPMRLPIPPRPHGFKGSTKQRLTRPDFKSFASADFATRAGPIQSTGETLRCDGHVAVITSSYYSEWALSSFCRMARENQFPLFRVDLGAADFRTIPVTAPL